MLLMGNSAFEAKGAVRGREGHYMVTPRSQRLHVTLKNT